MQNTSNIHTTNMPTEKEDLVAFAESIIAVNNKKPSEKEKEIMKLYENGDIDYEAAKNAIMKLHKNI